MTCPGCAHPVHDAYECATPTGTWRYIGGTTFEQRCGCAHGHDAGDIATDDDRLRIGSAYTDRTAPTWDLDL